MVERVRRRVEELTGIPASNVFIAATHTHSGPSIPRSDVDPVTANNAAVFEDKLVGVATWAKSLSAPARIFYRRGHAQCGVNRRENATDASF